MTHGTTYGYKRGCRCDACRAAIIDYQRAYRHRTGRTVPRADYVAEVLREHGASGYKKRGCRCDICREAMAEMKRRWRAKNPGRELEADRLRKRKQRAAKAQA